MRSNTKFPIHLYEFLNNTESISETKVNFIKNYFYNFARRNLYLKDIVDFKIGSSKNKNLLWMQSYEKKEVHLILHLPSNNFYFITKEFPKSIYLSFPITYLNEDQDDNENLIIKKQKKICPKLCKIL